MLADLRAAQASGWVNQFLQEYRLNSSEGVALLSLAEAFLRVPDPETADLLIADKLGDADWRAHTGKSASGLVNIGDLGLGDRPRAGFARAAQAGVLRRLISRAGEPFVRQAVGAAMKMMGEIFVMGRTIDEALGRMDKRDHRGFTASFDMLGEAARTHRRRRSLSGAYIDAIDAVGRDPRNKGHSISVKLSALHPRYEVARWHECVPRADRAARGAGARRPPRRDRRSPSMPRRCERLEMSFDIIGAVAALPALEGLGRLRHGGAGLWQARARR